MKFKQDLIEKLKKGEVVLHNYPKNESITSSILEQAFGERFRGDSDYYWKRLNGDYWCGDLTDLNNGDTDAPIIQVADFLDNIKYDFKVGDLVTHYLGDLVYKVIQVTDSRLTVEKRENGRIIAALSAPMSDFTLVASEEQSAEWEIGKEYEFTRGGG